MSARLAVLTATEWTLADGWGSACPPVSEESTWTSSTSA